MNTGTTVLARWVAAASAGLSASRRSSRNHTIEFIVQLFTFVDCKRRAAFAFLTSFQITPGLHLTHGQRAITHGYAAFESTPLN